MGGQNARIRMINNLPIHKQLKEYLRYCESVRGMSKQTINSKKFILQHFEEDCGTFDLEELDNYLLNNWIANQVSSGVSHRTINGRVNHIVAMMKYHRDMGMNIKLRFPMVMKLPERPPRRIFYSREQIDKALGFADDLAWLLIKISFDAGMRITELTNLKINDFSGRMVRYIGKGSKDRKSFISDEALERLESWCEYNKIDDGWLWPSPANRGKTPYSVDEIRHIMRQPFHRAGMKDFYPHALRHSFATDIQLNGAQPAEAQQMLGHSKLETTERYMHGLDDKMEELFNKYKGVSIVNS